MFLNMVGAFGGSSSPYWWGRLIAAAHRAGLLVVSSEWPLWALLFADDFELAAEGSTYCHAILCFLWWLVVLGFPFSWPKTRGGFTYSWVGYEVCRKQWALGISEGRANWAIRWMGDTLEAGRVHIGEMREALGRLVFVYGVVL